MYWLFDTITLWYYTMNIISLNSVDIININIINSPLDLFEVTPLLQITGAIINDWIVSITNYLIYGVLVTSLITGAHIIIDNNSRLVPSYWSIIIETVYASVISFSRDQLGSSNIIYIPFIYTLFWIIIISNLLGNIPYGFTLSASLVMSIGLSITVWLAVTIISVILHGIRFFSYFVPVGTPIGLVPLLVLIEVVSYIARAVSLGVRLFANIVAGHMLLAILASFLFTLFTVNIIVAFVSLIPIAIFIALIGLEIAVSIIQAYVFVTLTCSYIHDAIELH